MKFWFKSLIFFILYFQTEKVQYVGRLITGLGSSKSDARTGVYTTLVGLLSTIQPDEYPTISDLFSLMDAKLKMKSTIKIKVVSKGRTQIYLMHFSTLPILKSIHSEP